jgi:hypothetical protein
MNSEFIIHGDYIEGTIGDNNIVGQLSNLPLANVEFRSINGSHSKTITTNVGTKLKLKKSDFPDDEYLITITFNTEKGEQTTYAYINTVSDVITDTRELIYKELPKMPESPLANYYSNFISTMQWLDQANKMWEHPYGYRRYLDGVKNAHKGARKLIESTNPFDGVFPQPLATNFSKKIVEVKSNWKIFDEKKADDFITEKIEEFWTNKFEKTPKYINKNHQKATINLIIDTTGDINEIEGSYKIEIGKKNINIKAKSRQGLFYGVSTLLQVLDNKTTLPIGEINDKPAYPVRSIMLSSQAKVGMNDDFKTYINKAANLRYNEIYLYSNSFLHLDDPKQLLEMKEVFAYCKAHFIEPVPFFETFGSSTLTRVLDTDLDEGTYHENEKYTVSKEGEININAPRIHDNEYQRIKIVDNSGNELKREIDYRLVSTEKPIVKILNKKYFNRGLYLSFDAVDFTQHEHTASCPSNPKGWIYQEKVISSVINKLQPTNIHISQDEVGFINSCSLCKARGLSNKELMIDQINKVHAIIRKYDKNIGIYIWGDMFNDLQNAPKIGVEGSIAGLPKDIMVYDWNYIGVYHSEKVQTINQMKFYLDRGYKSGGVSWFEPANILDIMLTGEKYNDLFLGIMHSAWSGFDYGLLPTAEANWTGNTILNKLKF